MPKYIDLSEYGFDTEASDAFRQEADQYNQQLTTTPTQSKIYTLQERKQKKLERFGSQDQMANLSDSYTQLDNGLLESNNNKIWNDMGGAQVQDMLSDAANQQVYRRDDGSMFQYDPRGNEVDFAGQTRRAYMYGTKTDPDAVKFGLARGDLDSSDARYVPGMVEGYGWDPGKDGVDIDKNYMDMLLPYATATALEAAVHGRKEALENRKYKDVFSPEALAASGTSEYYTSPEGVLGDTSKLTNEQLAAMDTNNLNKYASLEGAQPKYKQAQTYEEYLAAKATDKGYLEQLSSLPQAIAAGFAKGGYDAADTVVEFAGDTVGRGVALVDKDTGKAIDKYVDLGTDKEKAERSNLLVGYDDSFTKQNIQKVKAHWDRAWKKFDILSPSTIVDVDVGEIYEAAKDAFQDVETAGYSLGYMIPALGGMASKGSAKLVGGVVKEHTDLVSDNLKKVAKGEMLTKEAKDAAAESLKNLSKRDKTKLFLVNNADALAYGAMMNNNQMDEFIENNGGEDATLLRAVLGTAANAAGMKLDVDFMKAILKGEPGRELGAVVGSWLAGAGESAARKIVGTVAEFGIKATAAGLKEFPQEYGQTFIEEFNKIYGATNKEGVTVGLEEATRKAGSEAGVGAIVGLTAGTQTAAAMQTLPTVAGVLNSTSGKLQEVKDARDLKKAQDLNTEVKSEIVAGIDEADLGGKTKEQYVDDLITQKNTILAKNFVLAVGKNNKAVITDIAKNATDEDVKNTVGWLAQYKLQVENSPKEVAAVDDILEQIKAVDIAKDDARKATKFEDVQEKAGTPITPEMGVEELHAKVDEFIDSKLEGKDEETVTNLNNARESLKNHYSRVSGFDLGDVTIKIDEDYINSMPIKGKLKEGSKKWKQPNVNVASIQAEQLESIFTKGIDSIADIEYNVQDPKIKQQVVDKLSRMSTKPNNLAKVFGTVAKQFTDAIKKAKSDQTMVRELGKVFKAKKTKEDGTKVLDIKDGDLYRFLTIAAKNINTSTRTDTDARQTVKGEDAAIRSGEYWAATSAVELQTGKDIASSFGIKIDGGPAAQEKAHRKLGRLGIKLLENAGLAETTDSVYFKGGENTFVGSKDRQGQPIITKLSSAETAGAVKIQKAKDKQTDKDVNVFEDRGIRLAGVPETTSEEYMSNIGDISSRVSKLLLPNATMTISDVEPDASIEVDPVKYDQTTTPYVDNDTPENNELSNIRTLEQQPLTIKRWALDLFRELREKMGDSTLDKFLKDNPSIKDSLNFRNTEAKLLQASEDGSAIQKKGFLNEIMAYLDEMVDADGDSKELYVRYQQIMNKRIHQMETSPNFQADKVYSRYMMAAPDKHEYKVREDGKITKQTELLVAQIIEETGVLKGDNLTKQHYRDAIEIIVSGESPKVTVLEEEQITAVENLVTQAEEMVKKDTMLMKLKYAYRMRGGKSTFKNMALLYAVNDVRTARNNTIETEYMFEMDANASGVFNTMINMVADPKIRAKLLTLGLNLDGTDTFAEWSDAYEMLGDEVSKEIAEYVGKGSTDKESLELRRKIEEISKDLGMDMRELAKPPVMTWFYSAGAVTIEKEFVGSVIQTAVSNAVNGDKKAKELIARITESDIDPKNIEPLSKEHKAMIDYFNPVAVKYQEKLDDAFPGVKERKEKMQQIYSTAVDKGDITKEGGENYFTGTIKSALATLRSGNSNIDGNGTLELRKSKEVIKSKEDLRKAGYSDEEIESMENTIVTMVETMDNATSVGPIIQQNVDAAQLFEGIAKILYDDSVDQKSMMTVHDAFYGNIDTLLKLKEGYDVAALRVAMEYDNIEVLVNSVEEMTDRMEKSKDNYDNAEIKATINTRVAELRQHVADWREENRAAVEWKKQNLKKAKVNVLGVSKMDRLPETREGVKPKKVTREPETKVKQTPEGSKPKPKTLQEEFGEELDVVENALLLDTEFTFSGLVYEIAHETAEGKPVTKYVELAQDALDNYYGDNMTEEKAKLLGYRTKEDVEKILTKAKEKGNTIKRSELLDYLKKAAGDKKFTGFNVYGDGSDIDRLMGTLEADNTNLDGGEVQALFLRHEEDATENKYDLMKILQKATKEPKGTQSAYAQALGIDTKGAHGAGRDVAIMREMVGKLRKLQKSKSYNRDIKRLKDPSLSVVLDKINNGTLEKEDVIEFIRAQKSQIEKSRVNNAVVQLLNDLGRDGIGFTTYEDVLNTLNKQLKDPKYKDQRDQINKDIGKIETYESNGQSFEIGGQIVVGRGDVKDGTLNSVFNTLFHEVEHAVTKNYMAVNENSKEVTLLKEVLRRAKVSNVAPKDGRLARVLGESSPLKQVEELLAIQKEGNFDKAMLDLQVVANLKESVFTKVVKSIEKLVGIIRKRVASMLAKGKLEERLGKIQVDEKIDISLFDTMLAIEAVAQRSREPEFIEANVDKVFKLCK